MILIHHSMKIIQASFREWDHLSPLLPQSRELYKRKRFSLNLIRMILPRLSRLCTERANPLLHQFSFTKTFVDVVQQCIANLMSTFHLYPHSEVIASSFTERFEDILRWLYKTDKTNRDSIKHWRGWSREKFVEHHRLLYPQLSNAADKS